MKNKTIPRYVQPSPLSLPLSNSSSPSLSSLHPTLPLSLFPPSHSPPLSSLYLSLSFSSLPSIHPRSCRGWADVKRTPVRYSSSSFSPPSCFLPLVVLPSPPPHPPHPAGEEGAHPRPELILPRERGLNTKGKKAGLDQEKRERED